MEWVQCTYVCLFAYWQIIAKEYNKYLCMNINYCDLHIKLKRNWTMFSNVYGSLGGVNSNIFNVQHPNRGKVVIRK